MCAVSNVGDNWTRKLDPWKDIIPDKTPRRRDWPATIPENGTSFRLGQLEAELKKLKGQVEEMHEELRAAKAKDIADGNPDCEMEEKVKLLKSIADLVGVDLGDVFDAKSVQR